jgi:hypothetical protein
MITVLGADDAALLRSRLFSICVIWRQIGGGLLSCAVGANLWETCAK